MIGDAVAQQQQLVSLRAKLARKLAETTAQRDLAKARIGEERWRAPRSSTAAPPSGEASRREQLAARLRAVEVCLTAMGAQDSAVEQLRSGLPALRR